MEKYVTFMMEMGSRGENGTISQVGGGKSRERTRPSFPDEYNGPVEELCALVDIVQYP